MSLLEITKVDEKLFELCKEKITLQLDNQTKALYWLIILTCSFSQYDITKGRFKSDDEFESVKLRLKYGKSNLDKIEVYNLDYEKIIDKFDSKSTFFYLDPPYKGREHYYINHNFKNESHFELSRKLKNIKGKFALSYYNFPEMADWYSDCRIIKNKTLMGTEFLIMNY
jgi:DNA adenine methylase